MEDDIDRDISLSNAPTVVNLHFFCLKKSQIKINVLLKQTPTNIFGLYSERLV